MTEQLEMFAPRRARASDPATSYAATDGPDFCDAVYRAYSTMPPMTPHECAAYCFPDVGNDTIRSAISRLKGKGWLEPTGEKRPSPCGRDCEVLRASHPPVVNVETGDAL